jgi:hypothetical protein
VNEEIDREGGRDRRYVHCRQQNEYTSIHQRIQRPHMEGEKPFPIDSIGEEKKD